MKKQILFCALVAMAVQVKSMDSLVPAFNATASGIGIAGASVPVHMGSLMCSGVYQFRKEQWPVNRYFDRAVIATTACVAGWQAGHAIANGNLEFGQDLTIPACMMAGHVLMRKIFPDAVPALLECLSVCAKKLKWCNGNTNNQGPDSIV